MVRRSNEPVTSQSSHLNLVCAFASRLDAAEIPYLVVGSSASGVYGRLRTATDVDLLLDLDAHSAPRLIATLGGEFVLALPSI